MEETPENYSNLIKRLKYGDYLTFRDDLELLAQTFGSFQPLDDVAELSFENKELRRALLDLTKEHGQRDQIGLLSFHSIRRIGPEAIPSIREEWERNMNAPGIHYLHMCLMDIIAAHPQEEKWQHAMPLIAGQQIPLWIGMMQSGKTSSRGLAAWAIGLLAKYAPAAKATQAGESLISLLYDDDSAVQSYALHGLISIGDKNLLQDILLRLARIAHDGSLLSYLLSRAGEEIDLNAKDNWGKTALTYAKELGNEKNIEILQNAGAHS